MAQVYEQRKDADGFLYITYTDETTLGGADIPDEK
jgi:Autophagy protein Atg8 ubiquitin like